MEYVTSSPIDPSQMYEKIQKQTAGSVVLHYAVVRGDTDGQATTSMCFERAGDVEAELSGIADGLRAVLDLEDVLIVRRLGMLQVGDIISLIAASAPRRGDAFRACMDGIMQLKKMQTVKKTET